MGADLNTFGYNRIDLTNQSNKICEVALSNEKLLIGLAISGYPSFQTRLMIDNQL